jgi:O-antigen ligase
VSKTQNNNWYMWLPVLALAAIPFGRSVELLVLIMALLGLNDLVRNQNEIRQNEAFKLFSMVFLLFWIPGLISIIDAVNIERSTKSVGGMLRFYLVGIFIISRINTSSMHTKIGLSFAAIVTFWAIDGWLQASTGVDILGLETSSSFRISGIFGENARLGLMIIPFFSVALFALKKEFGTTLAIVTGVLLASTILMSGDRAAWVSLVVTLFLYIILFGRRLFTLTLKQFAILFISLSIVLVSVWTNPGFQQRIESVTVGFDGSYESVNKASSSRLPLWETAYKMFLDNPVNGVGVRSFRYAYPEYASANDPFVDFSLPKEEQEGQTHAHQVVLEFASETGLFGLVGYAILLWYIYIKWLPLAARSQAMIPLGYLVSLVVIFFPLNTHQAFFSSHWGQIVWMIIALAISSLSVECGRQKLALIKRVVDD